MKPFSHLYCILVAFLFASCGVFISKKQGSSLPERENATAPMNISPFASRASQVRTYAVENNLSSSYCFLIDMSIHSGRKRFFVYDLERNIVIMSGLVAHGSCGDTFLDKAKFSNAPGDGCTSLGKYKIGEKYWGSYGKSYRLYGLDNTNSNAYQRAVVLHGYHCVPDEEIYPRVVCNSLGCAMVSPAFFEKLASIIDRSRKPIVLWIYK